MNKAKQKKEETADKPYTHTITYSFSFPNGPPPPQVIQRIERAFFRVMFILIEHPEFGDPVDLIWHDPLTGERRKPRSS